MGQAELVPWPAFLAWLRAKQRGLQPCSRNTRSPALQNDWICTPQPMSADGLAPAQNGGPRASAGHSTGYRGLGGPR